MQNSKRVMQLTTKLLKLSISLNVIYPTQPKEKSSKIKRQTPAFKLDLQSYDQFLEYLNYEKGNKIIYLHECVGRLAKYIRIHQRKASSNKLCSMIGINKDMSQIAKIPKYQAIFSRISIQHPSKEKPILYLECLDSIIHMKDKKISIFQKIRKQ